MLPVLHICRVVLFTRQKQGGRFYTKLGSPAEAPGVFASRFTVCHKLAPVGSALGNTSVLASP